MVDKKKPTPASQKKTGAAKRPTTKTKAKKKKAPLPLILGTAAILGGVGGAAYWALTQRQAAPGDLPIGAEVIPQEALMTVSMTTDANQWQQLREFGTPQSQAVFDQNLAQVRDRVFTANGIDYASDIQPWVGQEITVAFLTPPVPVPQASPVPGAPLATPSSQSVLMVLPIRDPLKAKELLERPRPQAAALGDRTYQGFAIKESQDPTKPLSVTVLDGKYLVVSTEPKALDRAIDTYKGTVSLASTPGFKQAMAQIATPKPFGKLYVNYPATAAVSGAAANTSQGQGMGMNATLEREGIRFRGVSWLKSDSQRKFDTRNNAKIMPDRLPADTILMTSGGSMKQFWKDYSQGAATNSVVPLPPFLKPDTLQKGISETIGMDWEKDLIDWMDGEFSLALIPAPEGSPPTLPGIVLLVQTSDRRTAEAKLQKLDEVMASKYKVKLDQSQIGGKAITSWKLPTGGSAVSHGWLDDNVAFLVLGAPIAESLVPRPSTSLAASDLFKQGIPTDLNPHNGHFFINMERALSPKGFTLLQLPPANRDLISAIRSIGVTAAISGERTSRFNMLVGLKKGNPPAALPSPTLPASPAPLPSPTVSP